ncbi:hypothetical protein [Salinarchaeum laminariae]|uniref:hypothetical protein n=1 Tax=Salinarchaeum laminariae TaxID=869888 RepID=UPI0020BE8FEB|nr:hypothetical protein [Salinarchaeum laminariae]
MDPVPRARSLADPMPTAPAFARTYRGRDGWDRVLEYHRVADYCADHPDAGSSAVGNALDLPRGRISAWVDDGGAPDPVHGLRTALDREWLVAKGNVRRRRALAVCVAWIFAGGSIATEHFRPRFAAHTDAEQKRITEAAVDLGIQLSWIDRDDDGQGIEARPNADASVFGRVLVAAGAPTGPTHVLPQWIRDGPDDLQRAVAACYVECRGQRAGDARLLQIREEARSDAHLDALGELLVGVAGEGSYSVGNKMLRLDREATDALLGEIDIEV